MSEPAGASPGLPADDGRRSPGWRLAALWLRGRRPVPDLPEHYSSAPLMPPLVAGPRRPRATVALLHQGAWAGPDRAAQAELMARVGAPLVAAGYRVVSLDYAPGSGGLRSALWALRAELARRPGLPLCLYGESAGGHLALLAGARLRRVAAVATYAAITDFGAYGAAAAARPDDAALALGWEGMRLMFGERPPAAWQPVAQAGRLPAPVLVCGAEGDPLVPLDQVTGFGARRPATEVLVVPSAPPDGDGVTWVHGALARADERRVLARLRAFFDAATGGGSASAPERSDVASAP